MLSRLKEIYVERPLEFHDLESIVPSDHSIVCEDVEGESDQTYPNNNAHIKVEKSRSNSFRNVFTTLGQPSNGKVGKLKNNAPNVNENNHPNINEQSLRMKDSLSIKLSKNNVVDDRFVSDRQRSPTSNIVNKSLQLDTNEDDNDIEALELERVFSKVRHNHIEFVQELLAERFDINTVDNKGNTMMHICCQNNNKKMASMLIAHNGGGCELNVRNLKGMSPMDYAEKYGFEKLADFLAAHGAVRGANTEPQMKRFHPQLVQTATATRMR